MKELDAQRGTQGTYFLPERERFMKSFFSLICATVAFVLTPASSQADDAPVYGSVSYGPPVLQHYHTAPALSVYTPGTNTLSAAPNGAYHSAYAPGHPSFVNDHGPTYYVPSFPNYYQAPGTLHYYYGVYAAPRGAY
jgi:hypothetical protein